VNDGLKKSWQVKKAFPKGTGAVPAMNRGPPIMPSRGGPYPGPRGYGGGGQGYYGGHEGGYNQQVKATWRVVFVEVGADLIERAGARLFVLWGL
jgi:hypothetical protein